MKKLEILNVTFILRSDKKKTGASSNMMQLYLEGRRANIVSGEKVEIDQWENQKEKMKGSKYPS